MPEKLSRTARDLIEDEANSLIFSTASVWEIAIKRNFARLHPALDAGRLRQGLLAHDYAELAIEGPHAVVAGTLPDLHRDPFDRILIAQALIEGLTLLTSDRKVAAYPGPVRLV